MNKHFKPLTILAVLTLFVAACGAQAVQAQQLKPGIPKPATYQDVLGKSRNDKVVADFMASNYCSGQGQFQICPSLGLAFWVDMSQELKTVYLYASDSSFHAAYRGELPFSLTMKDTMAEVEQKLGQPNVEHAPQAGWQPGLPDEGGTPDHAHYWAIYKRFGLTVIYDLPYADEDANIYAVLVR